MVDNSNLPYKQAKEDLEDAIYLADKRMQLKEHYEHFKKQVEDINEDINETQGDNKYAV